MTEECKVVVAQYGNHYSDAFSKGRITQNMLRDWIMFSRGGSAWTLRVLWMKNVYDKRVLLVK